MIRAKMRCLVREHILTWRGLALGSLAALFWLYYMTPFVQFLLLPDRPATPFLLHVPLWGLLAIVLIWRPGGFFGDGELTPRRV